MKPVQNVRTHTCGELTSSHLSQEAYLCGWVAKKRNLGGVLFIDLRDRYGVTQILFSPESPAFSQASSLSSEDVVGIRGMVRSRPDGMRNAELLTGEIELHATELEILSEAKTPPFEISDDREVLETTRLKYRYLDLRRPSLQKNFVIKHRMLSVVRRYLESLNFLEIETPILYKSTPEGARDFIVPSRIQPGSFYALPQSPQTLKQLLMMAGMDRYYQIARCFRDEDLRADRQLEFSQIDIEASFVDEASLYSIVEGMVSAVWSEILNVKLTTPFPHLDYDQAMSRYGSDKPDVRFGLELQDLSPIFEKSAFKVFQSALEAPQGTKRGSIRGIVVPKQAAHFSRKDLDELQAQVSLFGAKGLLWIKVQESGELQSPASKFFSEEEKETLKRTLCLKPEDLVLIVADPKNKVVFDALGALRLSLSQRLNLIPKDSKPAFLWVTRFPLLEYDDKEGRYFACHHPFTRAAPESFQDFLDGKNLGDLKAQAYDLVLNGVEVGGGSLRNYRPSDQQKMFEILGLSKAEAQEKFGFFLEAMEYGTPPHGGVAFGVERLSAILCGVGPIRDMIAFPKTQSGQCLMSSSPSTVSPSQLKEVGIKL